MKRSGLTTHEMAALRTHLLALVRRPNPSGAEQMVRAYVHTQLRKQGWLLQIDPMGNLLGTRGQPACLVELVRLITESHSPRRNRNRPIGRIL